MKVIWANLLRNKPKSPKKQFVPKKCVATIGVFDGVHLGHKFILKRLISEAKKIKLPSLVITFDTPPEKLLSNKFRGYITSAKEKEAAIRSFGIDYLLILKNTTSLLNLYGKEFIKYILGNFSVQKFIVGNDFRFGKGATFDVYHLKKLSEKYKFDVVILNKKKKNGKIISSTLIRKLITEGKLETAKIFLGRNYSICGKIIRGRGYGEKIGFSTANIQPSDYVLARRGVYAAYTVIQKRGYFAAVNIGRCPTVTRSKRDVLEAHLINFNKNITGRIIKILFLERIREEKKFSSIEQLKNAIAKDIRYIAKCYLFRKTKALSPSQNVV